MPAAVRTTGRRTQATGSPDQRISGSADQAHDAGDRPYQSAFQRHDRRAGLGLRGHGPGRPGPPPKPPAPPIPPGTRFVARAPKSIHAQRGARAKAEGVCLDSLVIALIAEGLGRAKYPWGPKHLRRGRAGWKVAGPGTVTKTRGHEDPGPARCALLPGGWPGPGAETCALKLRGDRPASRVKARLKYAGSV